MSLNIRTVILCSVILLLLIIIIYAVVYEPDWSHKNYWMAHYVDSPWKVYNRSTGNFDDAAALALQRATVRNNPSPGDHVLAATIITRNILSQEQRLNPTAEGELPTIADINQAAMRRNMFNQAREHYMAALQNLDPIETLRRHDAEERRRNEYDDNAEFIINAALEFAFEGLNELLANAPIITDLELLQQINFVDHPLAAIAAQRREDLIAGRRAIAKEVVEQQGGTPLAGVNTYIELAIQNTNDPQNTHDTSVIACFRAIIERLRKDQEGMEIPTPDQVKAAIRKDGEKFSEGRLHRLIDVERVIDKTKDGERVIAIGATDAECLGRVWLRSFDPQNNEVCNELRQALFNALYDCWEEGIAGRNIVCVNGRLSRILSSLILLDWDKRNWEVKKFEQFKNEIFARASKVIKDEATKAALSGDEEMQRAGQLYLASSAEEIEEIGDVSESASEKLADKMRTAISAMIDDYVRELEEINGIKDAIPSYMIDATKQEAQAAVV